MAQASKAEEPSMEEILASIRRIISDEDSQGGAAPASAPAKKSVTPVKEEAADDMGNASEMSQDDLDKLFDMGGDVDDFASDDADEADDMAAAMAADAAEDEEDDDVLELTEELEIEDEEPMEMIGGLARDLDDDENEISFVEKEEPTPPPAPKPAPAPARSTMVTTPVPDDLPEMEGDGPLTSEDTGHVVHAAFDNLANLFVGSQAQTVEELVKEMLRPMLKAWLDQNLPGMVEQMVQKEIQRVTRRR